MGRAFAQACSGMMPWCCTQGRHVYAKTLATYILSLFRPGKAVIIQGYGAILRRDVNRTQYAGKELASAGWVAG